MNSETRLAVSMSIIVMLIVGFIGGFLLGATSGASCCKGEALAYGFGEIVKVDESVTANKVFKWKTIDQIKNASQELKFNIENKPTLAGYK